METLQLTGGTTPASSPAPGSTPGGSTPSSAPGNGTGSGYRMREIKSVLIVDSLVNSGTKGNAWTTGLDALSGGQLRISTSDSVNVAVPAINLPPARRSIMAMETQQNINSLFWASIILVLALTKSLRVQVQASSSTSGFAKTIRSADGGVIDCVQLYKQPALRHPLLKNHVIQMKPSSYPHGIKTPNHSHNSSTSDPQLIQNWHKNGGFCPPGTIPITRSKLNVPRKTARVPTSFADHRAGGGNHLDGKETDPTGHEFVQASIFGGNYYGATANINVWSPKVEGDNEFSTAQLWVYAGPEVNVIEFGWMVTKKQNQPSIFTSWTRDEYNSTGCYNLDCPGFVQTSNKYALGEPIGPVSSYDQPQRQVLMTIHKDLETGNWWLTFQGEEMGYFPPVIFTSLAERSNRVSWGGEVVNSKSLQDGGHTATEMGSGRYAGKGFSQACYFQNAAYLTSDGVATDPERIETFTSREPCYNIDFGPRVASPSPGAHFYFGGPGASPSCTF
ncbi:unnamed protein product [Linum trigynum]|uniref:Neprosin PEP catalytic domain-containing protein n=1 Tax=Linum trigynum TaxID=586398 RepID=A0AAV2CWA8_9ROSI